MKKLVVLLICFVLAFALVLPAAAVSKSDIVAYLKDKMPARYQPIYLVWAENILAQYDLTETQNDRVLGMLQELSQSFPADDGYSLHQYVHEQRASIMKALNEFCDMTGSYYTIVPSTTPDHFNDIVVNLYKVDGTFVAALDGDVSEAKRTGEFSEQNPFFLIGAITFTCLAGAFIFTNFKQKKAVSAA